MDTYYISNSVRDEAIKLHLGGKKIAAIKAIRAETRARASDCAGLKMCKEYVENGCPDTFKGGGECVVVLSTREELMKRMVKLTLELGDVGRALKELDEGESDEEI